jgi:hypothetical protein
LRALPARTYPALIAVERKASRSARELGSHHHESYEIVENRYFFVAQQGRYSRRHDQHRYRRMGQCRVA